MGFTLKKHYGILGDLLNGSGWVQALTEKSIAEAGTADSYLHATHIARTRYVHQVTALALSALQHIAYDSSSSTLSFEVWRNELKKSSPTFQFWDLILRIELSVFVIIRTHREKNLQLYIEALDKIMFIFFALDHYNYCRWLSAHIQDLQTLTDEVRCVLEQCWVIEKTGNRFSAIPLDQNHEQENAIVKGDGGIISITEMGCYWSREIQVTSDV